MVLQLKINNTCKYSTQTLSSAAQGLSVLGKTAFLGERKTAFLGEREREIEMSVEEARSRSAVWKEMRNVEDEYYSSKNDVRRGRNGRKSGIQLECGGKMRRYFTVESVLLLLCLTASLLILPLVLPPLPPPPLLLLLLPISILALLMLLAFMPSNARPAAYTCL